LSDSKKGTFVPLRGARPNTIDEAKIGPKRQGWEKKRFVAEPAKYRESGLEFYHALPDLIDRGVLKPTGYEVVQGLDVDRVNRQLDLFKDDQWPTRINVHVQ
jgi:NADPH:quinone reductase